MSEMSFGSPEMQQYFDSLPIMVQENMKQPSVPFNTIDALRKRPENLMRGQ